MTNYFYKMPDIVNYRESSLAQVSGGLGIGGGRRGGEFRKKRLAQMPQNVL
jgi:hypothetical protein